MRMRLGKTYYRTLAHNIYQLKEAGEVIRILEDSDIPVIVLKGAALLETVYPDPGLREMADIDLLVHPSDLKKCENILRGLNFSLAPTGELHYFKREGEFLAQIDLHWEIWYLKELKEIWQSAIKTKVGGVETLIMSPEDTMIYTISHSAVHHGMFSPTWTDDVLRLINYYKEIDWEEIIEKVYRYNLVVPVFHFFTRLNEWNKDSLIPLNVIKRLTPPLSKKVESVFFSLVLNNPPMGNIGHILHLSLEKGLYGKIKFLIRFLFPPLSFLKRRYNLSNNYKACFYYLIRPFLLLNNAYRLLLNV